jgi:TRL-like protein family
MPAPRHRGRWAASLLGVAALLALSGCAPHRTAIMPPHGILFAEYTAPLITPGSDVDVGDWDDVEIHVSHFEIPYAYLRIINLSWGEAAVEDAIRESGFSEVYFADYTIFNILTVWTTFTVRVYGVT